MKQELSIVVDDNDAVIAYTPRAELTINDRWRICSVLLQNPKGEVLIAQRSASKLHSPLRWGPSAAGTLSKGEDYLTCARREVDEELGFEVGEMKEIVRRAYDAENGNKRYCAVFLAVCDWPIEKFTRQAEEVEAYRWIAIDELLTDIQNHPGNYVAGTSILTESLQLIK